MSNDVNKVGQSSPLKRHEWILVTLSLLTFGSIALITNYNTKGLYTYANNGNLGVEILVLGAVKYPGIYILPNHPTLEDVLTIAQADKDVNARQYILNKLVSRGRIIKVSKKEYYTIKVQGAVKEPVTLTLPKGTLLNELSSLVELEGGDEAYLNKKRKIRPNEIIKIPSKKDLKGIKCDKEEKNRY